MNTGDGELNYQTIYDIDSMYSKWRCNNGVYNDEKKKVINSENHCFS